MAPRHIMPCRHANMSAMTEALRRAVRDLAEPTRHTEDRWVWTTTRHRRRIQRVVVTPSLLDQLRLAAWPYPAGVGGAARHRHSAPATDARAVRCAEVFDEISRWARRWAVLLHRHKAADLDEQVRDLVAGAVFADVVLRGRLAAEAVAMARKARSVSDWGDGGGSRKRITTCPDCGAEALAVDLGEARAACGRCGRTWGPRMIGVLVRRLTASG